MCVCPLLFSFICNNHNPSPTYPRIPRRCLFRLNLSCSDSAQGCTVCVVVLVVMQSFRFLLLCFKMKTMLG